MAFVQSIAEVVSVAVLLLNCFLGSRAQVLPEEEVEVLQAISAKLKNDWTITQNSCGSEEWNRIIIPEDVLSNVTCDCTFENGTVCHVTNMILRWYMCYAKCIC